MNERTGIEQLLARDRLIVSGAMLAVFLIAAVYTVMGVGMSMSAVEMTFGASEMPMQDMSSSSSGSSMMEVPSKDMLDGGMSSMMMPPVWSTSYAALVFLMWWVMMIAMMLPSVASIILLYSTLIRRSNPTKSLRFSRNVLGRLPRCLGIFQPTGNSATISSGIERLRVSDDDVTDESDHWCRGLDCSWAIPIHTCEGILSTTLSEPNEISYRETPTRL